MFKSNATQNYKSQMTPVKIWPQRGHFSGYFVSFLQHHARQPILLKLSKISFHITIKWFWLGMHKTKRTQYESWDLSLIKSNKTQRLTITGWGVRYKLLDGGVATIGEEKFFFLNEISVSMQLQRALHDPADKYGSYLAKWLAIFKKNKKIIYP